MIEVVAKGFIVELVDVIWDNIYKEIYLISQNILILQIVIIKSKIKCLEIIVSVIQLIIYASLL